MKKYLLAMAYVLSFMAVIILATFGISEAVRLWQPMAYVFMIGGLFLVAWLLSKDM